MRDAVGTIEIDSDLVPESSRLNENVPDGESDIEGVPVCELLTVDVGDNSLVG